MTVPSKTLDVICIGRVAVDLYGQQIGSRLEDMSSFAKYLGGSSGNVAYGTARLGLQSAMLARVGNEHLGLFLRETLQGVGCDTTHLITDPQRLTALAILGIKDKETFPLVFYRDNCADMALTSADISEAFIASAHALAITGTHLSHPQTREAVLTALDYAGKHNLKRCLDIDYRPVLWGLTNPGDGETRYIASDTVSVNLQAVLPHFDLIVGTEEEFHIAGGSTNTREALLRVRSLTHATLVCKRGAMGCAVFDGDIPASLDQGITVEGIRVEVLNVLGAGDAFMSGLLRGYLRGKTWQQACTYANACGALVVSRHGCAPAMPTFEELTYYLAHAEQIPRPDQDPTLNHLHRVTTRSRHWNELAILAFDHRIQLVTLAQNVGADLAKISELKRLIFQAARECEQTLNLQGQIGALIDSTYGQALLNEVSGSGWWLARPIELPGSRPLRLEHGNIGSQLITWPLDHIVKCLVFYHPDDEIELRLEQEATLQEIYRACCHSGHELLIELILPTTMDNHGVHYVRAITRFYNLGIKPDWWKLPSQTAATWDTLGNLITQRDAYCQGIVILGLDAPLSIIEDGFAQAAGKKIVKGFAIGRTVFAEAAREWWQGSINDSTLKARVKTNYEKIIQLWRAREKNEIKCTEKEI